MNDSEFDRKYNHYDLVKKKHSLSSIWSIYEVEDLETAHPYPSDAFVIYKDHWGDTKNKHYPVLGSTWADLYLAADRAIRESGDNHHIFIEDFSLKNGNELHMSTGS